MGLRFTYDLPEGTLIQNVFKRVLADAAQSGYSLPTIRRFGDTSSSPLTHIQLLGLVNRGVRNRKQQINLAPVITHSGFTIEALALDRRFAGSTCIDMATDPHRLIIRMSECLFLFILTRPHCFLSSTDHLPIVSAGRAR